MNRFKIITYKVMDQGSIFVANGRKYVKVGNSHAIDLDTYEDFIPALSDKFKVIGKMGQAKLQSLEPLPFQGCPFFSHHVGG